MIIVVCVGEKRTVPKMFAENARAEELNLRHAQKRTTGRWIVELKHGRTCGMAQLQCRAELRRSGP